MGRARVEARKPGMSARRIVAMAVALACHLVLLLELLRPATPQADKPVAMESRAANLTLRFVSPSQPAPAPLAVPVLRMAPVTRKAPLPARPATQVAARPPSAAAPDAPAVAMPPAAPVGDTADQTGVGDGGFQRQLRDAQHAQDIQGVPGSDRPVVKGIVMTDPMDQGVGAVMRSAQRLFGVTSGHCIDVQAWQQLSPDELIARHLTEADVAAESEKYHCNQPPGLHF